MCNTTAAVGKEPNYPRRFSDMPGFEWFRNWSHSFEESCSLSTNFSRLEGANGHPINVEQHHSLRALCHLHTRCVREHPDAPCPDNKHTGEKCLRTTEAQLRAKAALEDANTAFWAMGIAPAAHLFRFGGAILFPAAVFMFLLVASELSYVHASATQYWMCLEIAKQALPLNTNETPPSCRSKIALYGARILLVLLREYIVCCVVEPTILSIVSVTTSFDIVFCGAIAIVILQADQLLFSTLTTEPNLIDMSREYILVLSRRQHQRLEVEYTVVFYNAFFWMILGYVITVQTAMVQLQTPDSTTLERVPLGVEFGFIYTTDLLVEVCCVCREISEGVKITKRELCRRFGIAAIRKPLFCFILTYCLWVPAGMLFYSRNSVKQSALGDTKHESFSFASNSIRNTFDLLNITFF